MTYTEQDVERVAEAIANELRTPSHAFTGGGTPMPPPVEGIHLRIARTALDAMEREPRIAELEAQVTRLRAAVHDLRCSVDAGEFQDVVAAYLQTGDLNAVATAKGEKA